MRTFFLLFVALALASSFAVAANQSHPHGVIRNVYLQVNPQGHSEEVLSDLQQLQPQSEEW